jgi:hypothetical protein
MTRFALLLGLFWNASVAFGCDCVTLPVSQEKRGAEVVFRGTITEIRGGTVHFRVERVWKGNVGRTFEMPDVTGLGCIGFWPSLLFEGNDLLVFAWRLDRYPGDNEYFTALCSGTSLASQAGETLAKLGKGSAPRASPPTKLP